MAKVGHVLVIGASSGIGRAVVERLLPGAAVSAVARRADRLAELDGLGAKGYVADVMDLGTLPELLKTLVADQGLLTALVYCAGMQMIKPVRTMGPADVEQLYKLNLTVPTVLAGQFASRRISADDAAFCAVSSVAAFRPEPGIVAYGASKSGLNALIQGLAREIGPRRAVGVAPGWLDTEMTQAYPHLYGEAFQERLAKNSPVGPASIDAVVDCIEFLISSRARYITGEIVRVDGGAAL